MAQNRILFIGGNFSPELIGIGKYNGEMIDWLSNQGFDCTVVTSYPYYPDWKVQETYSKNPFRYNKEINVSKNKNTMPVKIYRCPQYTPTNPTGTKRMLLDLSFSISSLLVVIKLLFHKKYDYVIAVAPSFQIGLVAIFYKKLRGAKFLYHIQDLQIDTARELGMIKSTKLINVLLKIERFILKKADVISSISEAMDKKIQLKCDKQVLFFPNWVDTDCYYPLGEKDEIKAMFNFNKSDKIVLYSGAIGKKQGIDIILQVAKSLKYFTEIKFIICGSGYHKVLQLKAESMKLHNVIFMPLHSAVQFNQFLNMADAHLVIQMERASDLVMPSKLSTILSVGGLALVTAPPNSSLYNLVSANNMGILIPPENQDLLAEGIKSALYNDNETLKLNACAYANKFLSRDNILSNFSTHLRKTSRIENQVFSKPEQA